MDLVLGGWEVAGEGRERVGDGTFVFLFFVFGCGKKGAEGRGWERREVTDWNGEEWGGRGRRG